MKFCLTDLFKIPPNSAASSDLSAVEAGGAGLKANADRQGAGSIRKIALFVSRNRHQYSGWILC